MRPILVLAAALALIAAGCGSNNKNAASNSSGGATATPSTSPVAAAGGGHDIKLSAPADGSLRFDQSNVTAKAGKEKVTFANPAQVPHGVVIEGNGVDAKTKVVMGGSSSTSVDLKPGKYEFYCPVTGHKAAGMVGTLTVQ
jgi:plastocyanin